MEQKVYEGYKKTSTSKSSKKDDAQTLTSTKTTSSKKSANTPSVRSAKKSTVSKPRIAMFIDVDNVGISRENLLEILFFINGKYQIEQCKLYGFSEDTLPGIREIASEYNMTTIGKMKFKQTGVNCLDSRLLIDAYECAENNKQKIDMIFIWCYPCDLEQLFEKIVNLGVNTSIIDNSVFDCKNKFVSQTFKLYSPYNFTLEQSTYGKVQNQPSQIAPNNKIEPTVNRNPNIQTSSVSSAQSQLQSTPNQPQSIFSENAVPPTLPRRTILEKSNPNTPKKDEQDSVNKEQQELQEEPKQEEQTNETTENKPSSLVEEIARKLNLQMPTEDEIAKDMEEFEKISTSNNDMLMDLLKQAGFGNLLEDENTLKYEDTIGDL